MAKTKVLVGLNQEILKKLDERVEDVGLNRSIYLEQVIRKHLGFPSIFKEEEV